MISKAKSCKRRFIAMVSKGTCQGSDHMWGGYSYKTVLFTNFTFTDASSGMYHEQRSTSSKSCINEFIMNSSYLRSFSTLSNSFGYIVVLFVWFFYYKLMHQSTFVIWVLNNFYTNISNNADPDQRAITGATWSGSTL